MAVTDGSYMADIMPDACSAAFILECSQGRGSITGSFVERSESASAYRGELMGLMAIHLILEGVQRTSLGIPGSVSIYTDCLGAKGRVEHIPSARIPAKRKHADVLKTIMITCQGWSFRTSFHHVKAHQDDNIPFQLLDRPAQLNCLMDEKAKAALLAWRWQELPPQRPFPQEPLTVFVGPEKITGDSGAAIRYWAHRQLARQVLSERSIMHSSAFDQIDWPNLYTMMHRLPRLFQLWASKQILGVASTNKAQSRFTTGLSPSCPSCHAADETCGHILDCPERGRVEALLGSIALLDTWLGQNYTEP